ncbi:hypothetical protein RchiOBHm_Chr4g0387881 [Rosa chinensis]|uniref:Uncharacterized protein n=1 Tax=Rosa chinensis TaxID=74649 RepID=A0A2P6QPK1_ROSCH|nr:hypothetical protein RchiOBHm_Chr4g0387881 [Rosa chinensis]
MGSIASFVVDVYAHFGASLIPEMETQCEKECSKVYMLDSTQGHLILALETVHSRAACHWALWFHCLALPADKNGFLTVFSSQFCDFILLKANPCRPTTWGQMVSLRFDTAVIYLLIPNVKLIFIIGGMTHNNLNCAALPTAFWSPQMCKDIDQLQTHSTMIITLIMGVISEDINDQTKAISQPRSFSIDEVIDFLQINLEFSSLSHLLQGSNREALRISATSHVGVHLCALMHNCVFKYYICLLKQRMEFPWNYMPYNKLAIFLNWIIETWSGFKEVANIDTTLQPTVGVFYAVDNSSTGTDSEKMSDRDLLGDIIKTLFYMISEIIHVAPDNLDSFSAYLQPSRYDRDTSITSELSNENCNDSQDICGIARLVLDLASSVGAMYRAGADDAIFNINNVMVSWVPHMNRLVQGSFHHLIQWDITLEFVSTISIYGCFFYNNLGATFDNTMALQLVNIVDYAIGTSLNAFDRYWDKMFLLLAISAVLEPHMPKITFGDLDNEAGTNFGRHFRLEVKPVL